MEGNGQAYYQLGVADSGQLVGCLLVVARLFLTYPSQVGLTKAEMEATLETLEAMAGELGASVIINREIEVSPRLLASSGGLSGSSWWRNRRNQSSNLSFSITSTPASASPHVGGLLQLPPTGGHASSGNSTSVTETESSETEETHSSLDEEDDMGHATSLKAEEDDELPALDGCDPDEIIVRSAPVPIAHTMLRHPFTTGDRSYPGSADALGIVRSTGFHADNESDGEDLGVFGLGDLDISSGGFSASRPTPIPKKAGSVALPPKHKAILNPSKGKRPPNPFANPKTQEEIAARAASKRAKRDQRRAERKRAMVGPGQRVKPFPEPVVKGETKELTVEAVEALATALSNIAVSASASPGAIAETTTDNSTIKVTDDETTVAAVPFEKRLIVEALIVRKAGFGNGYVDLSRFDEEIGQLPNFSLG